LFCFPLLKLMAPFPVFYFSAQKDTVWTEKYRRYVLCDMVHFLLRFLNR
jgi:hypothetical protein